MNVENNTSKTHTYRKERHIQSSLAMEKQNKKKTVGINIIKFICPDG